MSPQIGDTIKPDRGVLSRRAFAAKNAARRLARDTRGPAVVSEGRLRRSAHLACWQGAFGHTPDGIFDYLCHGTTHAGRSK